MKKREFLIANSIIIFLMVLFGVFTFNIFSKQSMNDILKNKAEKIIKTEDKAQITKYTCSKKPKLSIDAANDEHLLKLVEYQDRCNSFVTDKLMIFIGFPHDNESAVQQSAQLAEKLELFHKNGISPIVIAEPYIREQPMEYREFMDGKYDFALDLYFSQLKNQGLTDEMMGVWVPFPESNTPNWANKDTEPSDFAVVVNKYLGTLKKYFPEAEGSILLNATTYEPDDLGWDNGDYISLAPYLVNLDKKLVGSFGIQGFPWAPHAKQVAREIFRASEFIQPDFALGAAQELRTRDIWINSGSFYTKYATNTERQIFVSLNDRKAILNGIIDAAEYIKKYQLNEYRVSINLFSEDKSETEEATDWSYFQNEDSLNVLKEFLSAAEEASIPVSIFDRQKINH